MPSKQRAGLQQKPKKQVLGARSSSAMNAGRKHSRSRQPDTKFDLTFKNPQQSFQDTNQNESIDKTISLNISRTSTASRFESTGGKSSAEILSGIDVDFELARAILIQAVNQFGTSMTYKHLDRIIQLSEHSANVNRHTRTYLKSLLINFERCGGDLNKALEMEYIKQRILVTASNHYR